MYIFCGFHRYFITCHLYFGVTAQWRAKHTVCRSMLALPAGMKTMMRCLPADIPPAVRSLTDEVDELGARFHRKASSNFPKSLLLVRASWRSGGSPRYCWFWTPRSWPLHGSPRYSPWWTSRGTSPHLTCWKASQHLNKVQGTVSCRLLAAVPSCCSVWIFRRVVILLTLFTNTHFEYFWELNNIPKCMITVQNKTETDNSNLSSRMIYFQICLHGV